MKQSITDRKPLKIDWLSQNNLTLISSALNLVGQLCSNPFSFTYSPQKLSEKGTVIASKKRDRAVEIMSLWVTPLTPICPPYEHVRYDR